MPRFLRLTSSPYRCVCCLMKPIYDQEASAIVCPKLAGFCCEEGSRVWPNNCPNPDHEMDPYERAHHFYLTAERAWHFILPFPNMNRTFKGEQN